MVLINGRKYIRGLELNKINNCNRSNNKTLSLINIHLNCIILIPFLPFKLGIFFIFIYSTNINLTLEINNFLKFFIDQF